MLLVNDFANIIKSTPKFYCKTYENNTFYILYLNDEKTSCTEN